MTTYRCGVMSRSKALPCHMRVARKGARCLHHRVETLDAVAGRESADIAERLKRRAAYLGKLLERNTTMITLLERRRAKLQGELEAIGKATSKSEG